MKLIPRQPLLPGVHRQKPYLIFFSITLFILAVALQILNRTPAAMLKDASQRLDISGSWKYCVVSEDEATHSIVSQFRSVHRSATTRCEWKDIEIPQAISQLDLRNSQGWILLVKTFDAPEFCRKSTELCSLFIGEIGDAAEANLNGYSFGRHGDFPPQQRYAKHYPLKLDIPPQLLRLDAPNELRILVRYMKRAQSGITKGPVAVLSSNSAHRVQQSIISQNLTIPLASALGTSLLGALTILSLVLNRIANQRLWALGRYSLACALFLTSYAGMLREYLPLAFASCLHFVLRFLMDFTFFEMTVEITGFIPRLRNLFRAAYLILLIGLILAYVSDSDGLPIHPLRGFDGAILLSKLFDFPLIFGAYLYGSLGALKNRKETGIGLAGLFAIASGLSLSGVLTFHGLTTLPNFVHFYPFFVVLIVAIALWSDYLFMHEELQIDSHVGRLALQVAHDIRSPIAALNVVRDDLATLPPESRTLVTNAVTRIQDIAHQLLSYRRGFDAISSIQVTNQGFHPVIDIVQDILDEKRVSFRNRRNVHFEFTRPADQNSLTACIDPKELKRVISNVLDNSVEAIAENGLVEVIVSKARAEVVVTVQDNGIGMPESVLRTVGKRRFSYGKASGSGIGLLHARTSLERWGGRMNITSRKGRGTSVELRLPASKP
jgi:signal transduction histidine kinase